MNRNHLVRYGKLSLSLATISFIVLLGGCCKFCDIGKCCPDTKDGRECDMDVVFAFDIPTSQNDCGDTATYIPDAAASAANDLKMHSGGAGVVDRSGGGGVVDRNGNSVTAFCIKNCEPPLKWRDDTTPWIVMSSTGGVLIAETACY